MGGLPLPNDCWDGINKFTAFIWSKETKKSIILSTTQILMKYSRNWTEQCEKQNLGGANQNDNLLAHFLPLALSKFISWRFSNRSLEFKKTLLAEFEIVCAISREASIFLSVMNAGLLAIAWPISWALLASPCSPERFAYFKIYVTEKKVNHPQSGVQIKLVFEISCPEGQTLMGKLSEQETFP